MLLLINSARAMVVFAAVASFAVACAHRPAMVVYPALPPCGKVVPEADTRVTWIRPDDPRDRARLVEWCGTVGPLLAAAPAERSGPDLVEELAVLTWNVHVGGGNLSQAIAALRSGTFTDGRPMRHFVLLLQETHRQSFTVPSAVPDGLVLPSAIVEAPPEGARRDIEDVAAEHDLHVFYVPAMRNGHTAIPEDRGSAVLSTLPLSDLEVIELPFERQRRVALAATIAGRTPPNEPWQLRLATVHVDTSLALTRGGPVAARKRQAEALVEALAGAPGLPTLVGGDFNTWLGSKEPALSVMRRAFPDTPAQPETATWRGPLGIGAALDHVFVRGPFEAISTGRLPDRFGSDHYPLLTRLRFAPAAASQPSNRASIVRGSIQSSVDE